MNPATKDRPRELGLGVRVVDITDPSGQVCAPEWLARAEVVHRQLRPQLPPDYAGKMRRVCAGGGRICAAVQGDAVFGVAVYRVYENTFAGVQMYVDDLVTDAAARSRGVGAALFAHLETVARQAGCAEVTLDSGTQRQQAHKFYFREGMVVTSFHFDKKL